MTATDTINDVVDAYIKDNNLEDSNESRLSAMLDIQSQWDDNVEPSWPSSMLKASLALKISHTQMKIRLNLD